MEKEIFNLIDTFLTNRDFTAAAQQLRDCSTEETAQFLKTLDDQTLIPLCRELDSEVMAEALLLLDPSLQESIISGLRDDELEAVMDEMSVDDTVEINEDMPQEIVRRKAEQDEILMLLEEPNYAV